MDPEVQKPTQNYLVTLHQNLVAHFSDDELRTLCFDLQVEYDDLPSQGRASRARDLIAFLVRRDRVTELIELCAKQRPNVDWQDILQAARQAVVDHPAGAGGPALVPSFWAGVRLALLHDWRYAAAAIGVVILTLTGIVVLFSGPIKPAPAIPAHTTSPTLGAVAVPTTATLTSMPAPTLTPTSTPSPTPVFGSGTLYNVAIAKIDDRLAPKPVEIAARLQDDLQAVLQKYNLDKDVAVKVLPQVIQSEDEAREFAATSNSTVVIWGLYDSLGIRLRVFLGNKAESPESQVIRLSELPLGTADSGPGSLSFYIHDVLPSNTRFLALYVVGHLYYLANNYAEGHKAYDAAAKELEQTPQVKLENEALIHFFNARLLQANTHISHTSEIITDFPAVEAHNRIAMSDTLTATCEYAKAIELDNKLAEAYNNLGVLAMNEVPRQGGGSYTPRVFDRFGGEPCLKAAGIPSLEPAGLFSQALDIHPKWTLPLYNLAVLDWNKGWDVGKLPPESVMLADRERVRARFETVLQQDPTIPGAHIALGNMAVWQGQFDVAADHFARALALSESAMVAINLGQAWALAKQDDRAIAAYQQALALEPDSAGIKLYAHRALGNLYHRRGDLAQAGEEYKLAGAAIPVESCLGCECFLDLPTFKYQVDTNTWSDSRLYTGYCSGKDDIRPYILWLNSTIRQEPGTTDGLKPSTTNCSEGRFFAWIRGDASSMAWCDLVQQCAASNKDDVATWGSPANPCLPADLKARLQAVYAMYQLGLHYSLFFNDTLSGGAAACPYIFTYDERRANWSADTTILYRLVGPEAKTTQERPLAHFDGRLWLRELELETSYIDMLYVRIIAADGREVTLIPDDQALAADDGRILILHQGDDRLLNFRVPDGALPVRQAWVGASGYYVPDER
jgi:tetratricopeptide (TPR) repeat protein